MVDDLADGVPEGGFELLRWKLEMLHGHGFEKLEILASSASGSLIGMASKFTL